MTDQSDGSPEYDSNVWGEPGIADTILKTSSEDWRSVSGIDFKIAGMTMEMDATKLIS